MWRPKPLALPVTNQTFDFIMLFPFLFVFIDFSGSSQSARQGITVPMPPARNRLASSHKPVLKRNDSCRWSLLCSSALFSRFISWLQHDMRPTMRPKHLYD
jgi:hypothetical protein